MIGTDPQTDLALIKVSASADFPETVKLVIGQLRDKGHVTRGWIGVQLQPITPAIAEAIW